MTVLCLSLAFLLMVASFWAEAAVMALLLDPETGKKSTGIQSAFGVKLVLVYTSWPSIYVAKGEKLLEDDENFLFNKVRYCLRRVLWIQKPLCFLILKSGIQGLFKWTTVHPGEIQDCPTRSHLLLGELAADIGSTVVSNVPSVLYSLLIIVCNALYLKLARRLTIWENHRSDPDYRRPKKLKSCS